MTDLEKETITKVLREGIKLGAAFERKYPGNLKVPLPSDRLSESIRIIVKGEK